MKKTIIVAAALAAFAATAAPGVGARESFATNVLVQGYENLESGYLAHGVIEADKSKCRGNRKVQMLIDPGSGFEIRDSGKSSKNGAWALQADSFDATGIKAKALRKELPNGDVCRPASSDVPF